MKNILVPIDFSKAASNACIYAIDLAKTINANVTLFHVYHIPIPPSGEVPVMIMSPEELALNAEAALEKEVLNLKETTGFAVAYLAVLGVAVDDICEKTNEMDLIVMGIQGAGKIKETLVGSIVTSTIRKSKKPVLIIPENARFQSPLRIVLACDYKPGMDLHGLDMLLDIMKNFDSEVFIINVKQKKDIVHFETDRMVKLESHLSIYKVDAHEPHENVPLQVVELREKLENKLSDVEHYYYNPEKKNVVEAINDFVGEKQADMVAIIPHHYKLLEGLFHKSLSKMLAFHTHIPLLSLPDNR